jgi:ABC-type bacteriocin/lantibiotic exporter with double-glycine peptidase domain
MLRNKIRDLINGSLDTFMPLIVYGLYIGMGNSLDLPKMAVTQMMMGQICGRMHQCRHLISRIFGLEEALEKLNDFYFSPDMQKGLVDKKEESDSEFAINVQGNFSWGVNGADKEDVRKKQEEARKKDEDEMDKKQGCLRRFMRKSLPGRRKHYEIPYSPRNLDNIISLKDLDLKVKKGEFVVIVGEVGSGKTSLLNAMIGEMIHLPQNEIDFIGDQRRKLSSEEQKALENVLLQQEYANGESPV